MSEAPMLILLCGIPGLGKDYLCENLKAREEFSTFDFYSQDQFAVSSSDIKPAELCRRAVRKSLAFGRSVIVKRNNFMASDRASLCAVAREVALVTTVAVYPSEMKGDRKSILLYQTALKSALGRLQPGGPSHETLNTPELVPHICSSFFCKFQEPSQEIEDLDFIFELDYLRPMDESGYHFPSEEEQTEIDSYPAFSPLPLESSATNHSSTAEDLMGEQPKLQSFHGGLSFSIEPELDCRRTIEEIADDVSTFIAMIKLS